MFFNHEKSQAEKPGFWLFGILRRNARGCVFASLVLFCLVLTGSCNLAAKSSQVSKTVGDKADFASMSRGDLMRYAYDLQHAAAENSDILARFSAQDIFLMLAQPDLKRQDFPSVVWQYRSDSCVLDVYYSAPDASAAGVAPVQHYEIRERALITDGEKEGAAPAWNCLQSLYHERRIAIEAGFEQIYAQAANVDG